MKKALTLFLALSSFLLNAQQLISVTPNSGSQGETLTISISGQHTTFKQGTNAVHLTGPTYIGARSFTAVNDSLISATFSFDRNHPTGVYTVNVNNSNGTLQLLDAFTLTAGTNPHLIAINPNHATQGETLTITISGQNTTFNQASNIVNLNGPSFIQAKNIVAVGDSLIAATFAFNSSHPSGLYTLSVSNTVDGSIQLANAFTLYPSNNQRLVAITPDHSTQGETLTVSISGQRTAFKQASNAIGVNLGGFIFAQAVTAVNDSLLNATFTFNSDHPAGLYTVNVYSAGNVLSLPDSFTLGVDSTPPSLIAITPATARQGETVTVTITGNNTNFDIKPFVTLYSAMQTVVAEVIPVNSTTIKAKFIFNYSFNPGVYMLRVSNSANGTLELANAFTLTATSNSPQLVAIAPDHATQGETLTVAISGQYTDFKQASNGVYVNLTGPALISAQSLVPINDSLINATFAFNPTYPAGFYTVNVTSNNKTYSLANSFRLFRDSTIPVPHLVNASPNHAKQLETLTIAISGQHTSFKQASNQVYLTRAVTIYPQNISVVNDSLLNATFYFDSTAQVGDYIISVYNAVDGAMSLQDKFKLKKAGKKVQIMADHARQGETVTLSIIPEDVFLNKVYKVILKTNAASFASTNATLTGGIINATFTITENAPVGYYDVIIEGDNNHTYTNSFLITEDSKTSSLPVLPGAHEMVVFPNPAISFITLDVGSALEGSQLGIFNMIGELIYSQERINTSAKISLSGYPSGIYFVQLIKNGRIYVQKVLKN